MIEKVVCDECKFEFELKSVNIEKREVEINGKKFELSYFKCPNCNKLYRVCLVDDRYYEMCKEITDVKERVRRASKNGNKEFAKSISKMVPKKVARLRLHVEALKKAYSGTFYEDDDGILKYLP